MHNAIVLSGSIGTGKSTVANMLKLHGYRVIDADVISRTVYDLKSESIKLFFGTDDRREVAARVFASRTDRFALEQLLHPAIIAEIRVQAEKLSKLGRRYFVDIPLYFENRSDFPFTDSVVVYAPREQELERLVSSRNLTEEEANARINAQMSIEEKKPLATWVIDNSKDIRHLTNEVEKFVKKVAGNAHHKI